MKEKGKDVLEAIGALILIRLVIPGAIIGIIYLLCSIPACQPTSSSYGGSSGGGYGGDYYTDEEWEPYYEPSGAWD